MRAARWNQALICAVLLAALGWACDASSQTIRVSCPRFLSNRNQAIACTEALFSQDHYHFTLASLPPSNGFGPGLVLITHVRRLVGDPPRINALDLSVTGAVTTNSSWFAGGSLVWLPPLAYRNDPDITDGKRLGPLLSTEQMSIHLAPSHRTVRTLYFYGEGSRSSNTRYVYAQDDTSFDASVRMPLAPWLVATGESEVRSTTLPPVSDPAAVVAHFPATITPGINAQPLYLHNALGASTFLQPVIGKTFAPLPAQDDPHFQSRLLFTLANNVAFHWQQPADGSPYAYQQFIFDGSERMQIHRVVRNFFDAKRHPFLHYVCEGNKRTDECDFGQFDVKSRLVLTHTSGNNQVPFYLQSTLGGTDIDSRPSLRSYDNYRFRGPDLALVQFEYGVPVYDPVGVFVFYDAGAVGNTAADLSLQRFRQDAGFGLSVRIKGNVLAQTFYAFGEGHGGRWNYNFAKAF